jgi:alanine dehydrogenase
MKIGVPTEIKVHESRVALTPAGVRDLTEAGHEILIQAGAGAGVGIEDRQFAVAGARIAEDAKQVFVQSELVVKVKEPQLSECAMLRPGQVLFTYLHLAAEPAIAKALMDSMSTCVAYETVTSPNGSLPLLTPMSEVAGRMAIQVGAYFLQKAMGGSGVLLGGVPGVLPGNVVVLGGGVAGRHAAEMALGLGASVTILDVSLTRLRELALAFGPSLRTVHATAAVVEELVQTADLVIGAVLVTGAAAPKLVTRRMLSRMRPGSVLVDISIDQGGCFETSRPTTHADPTFTVDGVVHYCVTNMPGAVARTSTFALTSATLPYIRALAAGGVRDAVARDPHLGHGVNVHGGAIVHPAVADALGLKYQPFN